MYAIIRAMHSLKFFISASIAVTLHGCANLQPKTSGDIGAFSAQGWGGTTCNEMLHDIHTATAGERAGQNIGLYQSWVSGFISGVNYTRNDVYDVSGATGPTESFEWIKNYCLQNPVDPLPLALHKLIQHWQNEGKVLTQAEPSS